MRDNPHPSPFPTTRQGTYVLGEVSKLDLARSYTTYAGVDVRVFITDVPWTHAKLAAGEIKSYNNAQGISWVIDRQTNEAEGTLVDLCLDHMTFPKGKYLTVVAFNEYGKACVMFEGENFEILKSSSGVCIDDIVIEQAHTFVCDYLGAYPLPAPEKFETEPLKPTFEDWN
jgi:hypothetical protein